MELVIRDARGEQRVRVERREGRYFVRVGEGDSVRHYEVDAVTLGPRLRSLLIEGRQFDVGLAPLAGELPGWLALARRLRPGRDRRRRPCRPAAPAR